MKLTEQDIIRTARQLRDEENQQLNVHPWHSHRRHHLSTWLVAIPAAAIIGFMLGIWTQAHVQSDAPLTALVDTIYINVHDSQPHQDTIAQVLTVVPTPKPAARRPATIHRAQPVVGRPVANDNIRYDLLVRN